MGSRWRDRTELFLRVNPSVAPVPDCTEGISTITFPATLATGATGRQAPVGISLPPGYCSSQLQQIRYPVVYLLHGYEQTPQDLEPIIAGLQANMNDATKSTADRLVKAIIVYVDGRCRGRRRGGGVPARVLLRRQPARHRRAGRDVVARADELHGPDVSDAGHDAGGVDGVNRGPVNHRGA